MKKVHTKQHPFLLVLLLLFLTIIAQKGAKSLATAAAMKVLDGCNPTRIGDCLTDDDEFLTESVTSRSVLAASGNPMITPGAQNPEKPFCDRNVYGSCIKGPNKLYDARPCNYKNACDRASSGT